MPQTNTFGQDITQFGGSPVPTPAPAVPSSINSGNTAPSTPIDYKTPTPTPIYPVNTLDPTVPTPPAQPTPAEGKANDLTTLLEDLTNKLVGKTADQTVAETAAGLPELQKTQNDLAAQLKGIQNEAAAIPNLLQNEAVGRGITAGGLAPIQTEQLRNNAIKALTVSTLLEATKGNIANAQATADKAIATKYGSIEEEIKAATANLNLVKNSPEYSLEEKNRAQAQLDIQNAKQAKIDKAKADDKAISDIAIKAAQNGADAVTLKNIMGAKSPSDAATAAGTFGKDAKTSVQEIGGRKVLIDENTGKTIKDLGAATVNQTATERDAAKLQSYAAAFVPGAKMSDGTPVLDANGYATPAAFKAAIAEYPDRNAFIKKYGYLLFPDKNGNFGAYGLTPAESKLINGTLPAAS